VAAFGAKIDPGRIVILSIGACFYHPFQLLDDPEMDVIGAGRVVLRRRRLASWRSR
jgi:hypothetical protein